MFTLAWTSTGMAYIYNTRSICSTKLALLKTRPDWWLVVICHVCDIKTLSLLGTNIAPDNQCLEDIPCSGAMLVVGRVNESHNHPPPWKQHIPRTKNGWTMELPFEMVPFLGTWKVSAYGFLWMHWWREALQLVFRHQKMIRMDIYQQVVCLGADRLMIPSRPAYRTTIYFHTIYFWMLVLLHLGTGGCRDLTFKPSALGGELDCPNSKGLRCHFYFNQKFRSSNPGFIYIYTGWSLYGTGYPHRKLTTIDNRCFAYER